MKMLVKAAAAVVLLLVASGDPASADMIFNLSGVTMSDGTMLAGSFTTDDAIGVVKSWNIAASAKGGFVDHVYNPGDSTSYSQLASRYLRFDGPSGAFQMRLDFAGALTAGGTTLLNSSYEYQSNAGPRTATGGLILAAQGVPEPGSVVLLGTAAAAIAAGGVRRARRRSAAAAAA